ncbi:unnamed protein product [Closterium sp. NIES-53]
MGRLWPLFIESRALVCTHYTLGPTTQGQDGTLPSGLKSPRVACVASPLACAAVYSLRRGPVAHCPSLLLAPPTTAPFQTLHLDDWDDYSHYTTVFPLRRKADVPTILELWLLVRGGAQGLCGLCLHSDRGVPYAAHQLNLWPSDARPRVTPISLWTRVPPGPLEVLVRLRSEPMGQDDSTPTIAHTDLLGGWDCLAELSPPQRPFPVVSGGVGGAVAEGEGIGATGAGGVGSGGAGGVGVEVTLVEDKAASTLRPRPASPPGFPSVPQFPPRAGSGGAGAGGSDTVAPTPRNFLTCEQRLLRLEREERERRGGVTAAANAVAAAAGESRGGVTSAAMGAIAVATGESRGGVMAAPGEGRAGVPPAAVGAVTDTAGESRGVTAAAGEGSAGVSVAVAGAAAAATGEGRGGATGAAAGVAPSVPLSCRRSVSPCSPLTCSTSSCRPTSSKVVPHCVSRPVVRLPPCLSQEVLEDRQFELGFLATAIPHLCAMLLAPEENPNALDIPISRTHAEAVSGPWALYSIAAEEAEMASYRSTATYVDAVPPPRTNVVSGMWLYKVKRPPGAPPVFKACYVARGFSQREGVDFFQNFTPTPKMTTLWVLLHIAAQRSYELHSLDFSTAFLQKSLHKQIWLRCPPGFTCSFPPAT